MKLQKMVVLLLFLFFFFPQKTFAQVVINEFSSASNPEWVEFYNQGAADVPLDGWSLFFQDTPDIKQKATFGPSDSIPAQGYKIFERPYIYNFQAWLKNDGDIIILKDQNLVEVDSVRYGSATNAIVGAPSENQSAGRSSDGGSSWIIFDIKTQNTTNNTSTSTSTPTPTSPSTPTPTKTPTPKPSTPKPTTTPIGTSVSVSLVDNKEVTESSVLSESTPSSKIDEKTPAPAETQVAAENNLQKILIGAGLLFIISSGFWFIRSLKQKSQQNE